jgi:hypothetical protein
MLNQEQQNDEEVMVEAETSLHQLSQPTVKNTHEWKQRGNHVVCDSCESSHGFILKPGQQLIGVDEKGLPKIIRIYI